MRKQALIIVASKEVKMGKEAKDRRQLDRENEWLNNDEGKLKRWRWKGNEDKART